MEDGMNIRVEMANLGSLATIGLALADYCESIANGGTFEQNGTRWVIRPNNYVTLEPHWKRVKNVAISLHGNPSEFAAMPELPLKTGMAGYSECKVESINQLAAAAFNVRQAKEIYSRGRNRTPKKMQAVET